MDEMAAVKLTVTPAHQCRQPLHEVPRPLHRVRGAVASGGLIVERGGRIVHQGGARELLADRGIQGPYSAV